MYGTVAMEARHMLETMNKKGAVALVQCKRSQRFKDRSEEGCCCVKKREEVTNTTTEAVNSGTTTESRIEMCGK